LALAALALVVFVAYHSYPAEISKGTVKRMGLIFMGFESVSRFRNRLHLIAINSEIDCWRKLRASETLALVCSAPPRLAEEFIAKGIRK